MVQKLQRGKGAARRTALVVLVVLLAASISAVGCTGKKTVSREGFFFDTMVRISLYGAEDSEQILDRCFELCAEYDKMLSKNNRSGDIYRINSAEGKTVSVSDAAAEVIERGLYYSRLSDGAFDITCGRLTELWDFSSENPSVPTEQQLYEALSYVDYTRVVLDTESCTVTMPSGMKLDLGGIAKGYIADRIAEYLKSIDTLTGAIINLGGNIVTVGDNFGKPFRIGIQSPFSPTEYVDTVEVTSGSVVTAGSYQRCFTLDGVTYHHILDTKTGYPAESGVASVTVISDRSVDGDALSTICFILGEEKAKTLTTDMDGIEVRFVASDSNK